MKEFSSNDMNKMNSTHSLMHELGSLTQAQIKVAMANDLGSIPVNSIFWKILCR